MRPAISKFAMDLSYLNKLGLALLLCFQSQANQPPVTLAVVISHAQELRNATDFRASGRLVRIDGAQRKSYQISMRAKASAGVLRVFCEVTDPASSRVRILLESFPDGKTIALATLVTLRPRSSPLIVGANGCSIRILLPRTCSKASSCGRTSH